MEELNLFPKSAQKRTQVLFANFGTDMALSCLRMIEKLRSHKIRCEYYPDAIKIKKQFSYANAKEIPFMVVLGSEEFENKTFILKDMNSGNQTYIH